MARRRSTGKRLRFEVFKRDYFTCQYCGAQPPEIVLVVDHVLPVAAGGSEAIDNLVAACEPCNQGKADRSLGHVRPRTDADLLYLSTQQEIAEMRRYQQALQQREEAVRSLIETFQELWVTLSGLDWQPSELILHQLLDRYSVDVAGEAIKDVAPKVGSGYVPSYGRKWVGYLFTVARTFAIEFGDLDPRDAEPEVPD